MDAGPDALRTTRVESYPLGAIPAGDADLGPISPELALIDPELARRARELVPEPRERSSPHRGLPGPPAAELPAAPELAPGPEVQPALRRRWTRALVLAAVIFVVGAASGTVLAPRHAASPGPTLEVRAAATTTQRRLKPQAIDKRAALRPAKVSRESGPDRIGPAPRLHQRHARVVWAPNVLGVVIKVGGGSVALLWQRPAGSARVVVLRARDRGPSLVVYRGRAMSFRDSSIRPCTPYRYTMVNYDRRGHRSTGVPTSVVTGGCT